METQNNKEDKNLKLKLWFKRVGWLGLAFFTLKGLLWLVVLYYGADTLKACFK